jgi:hypothetical protein
MNESDLKNGIPCPLFPGRYCLAPHCLAGDYRYIYGLVDPQTGRLFYIGQTVDINKRYRSHILNRNVNADKAELVEAILNEGLIPLLIVFDIIPSSCEGITKASEQYYTEAARKEGYLILCWEFEGAAFASSFADRYGLNSSPFLADRERFLELAAMYHEGSH